MAVAKSSGDHPADKAAVRCHLVSTKVDHYTLSAGHIVTFYSLEVERCRGKLRAVMVECEPMWLSEGIDPPPAWTYEIWDGTWPTEPCDGRRTVFPSS